MSHSREYLDQSSSKLEWMYKNNTDLLNREEYLLGRPVDKNFEQLNAEENEYKQKLVGITVPKNHVEHECIPFSLRSYRSLENTEQVDLQRKIIEDPLMAIRQKEMESRRKILENPVKLKELHKLLKKEKNSNRSHKKKRNKKRANKEKERKRGSSSEENDLDVLIAKKYKKIQATNAGNEILSKYKLQKMLSVKEDDLKKKKTNSSNDERLNRRGQSKEAPNFSRKREMETKSDQKNKYSFDKKMKDDKFNNETSKKSYSKSNERKSGQSSSKEHHSTVDQYDSANSDDNQSIKKNYGLVSSKGKKIELMGTDMRNDYKNIKLKKATKEQKSTNIRREKLSAEEKEKRFQEMMVNAVWRDSERKQNISKYAEESAKDKDIPFYDKSFINKELHKAISKQTSVESRLKSNLNNIQRSSKAMESNFVKR